MRWLLNCLYALAVFGGGKPIPIPSDFFPSEPQSFEVHEGRGRFDTYVTVRLPFAPAETVRKAVERKLGHPLRNRGEAHITVLTPPEYWNVLRKKLSADDLRALTGDCTLAKSRIVVRCIGRATIPGEATYFVVLEAPTLVDARRKIHEAWVAQGGEPDLFRPEAFHPHVTLGYTKRDLHEADHVTKGPESCWQTTASR